MSTTSKGNEYEKNVKAILEAWGYKVERAARKMVAVGPGKFISRSNDYFGCLDLIAIDPYEKVRCVQVTDQAHQAAHQAKFRHVLFPMVHCDVEIWAWHPGRRRKHKKGEKVTIAQVFSVYRLYDDGWEFWRFVTKDGSAMSMEGYQRLCSK